MNISQLKAYNLNHTENTIQVKAIPAEAVVYISFHIPDISLNPRAEDSEARKPCPFTVPRTRADVRICPLYQESQHHSLLFRWHPNISTRRGKGSRGSSPTFPLATVTPIETNFWPKSDSLPAKGGLEFRARSLNFLYVLQHLKMSTLW